MLQWFLPRQEGDLVREKAVIVFCSLTFLVGLYSLLKWQRITIIAVAEARTAEASVSQ